MAFTFDRWHAFVFLDLPSSSLCFPSLSTLLLLLSTSLTTLHFHSRASSLFSVSTTCCPSSLLMRSCKASKVALERLHQPDWYSLGDASSVLPYSALFPIISIQPLIAFSVDHRTCFQIHYKAV